MFKTLFIKRKKIFINSIIVAKFFSLLEFYIKHLDSEYQILSKIEYLLRTYIKTQAHIFCMYNLCILSTHVFSYLPLDVRDKRTSQQYTIIIQ